MKLVLHKVPGRMLDFVKLIVQSVANNVPHVMQEAAQMLADYEDDRRTRQAELAAWGQTLYDVAGKAEARSYALQRYCSVVNSLSLFT